MTFIIGGFLSNALGLLLLYYVWQAAKRHHISRGKRWGLLVAGFLALIPIIALQTLLGNLFQHWAFLKNTPLLTEFFMIPVRLALTEEVCKMAVTLLVTDKQHKNYTPQQSVLLPTLTGLAFGLLENLLFIALSLQTLQENFWLVVFMRFLIGAPGHGAYGVISGFYYAKANQASKRGKYLLWAILVPSLIHGLYNWLSGSAILRLGTGYMLTYIMVTLDFIVIAISFYKLHTHLKKTN